MARRGRPGPLGLGWETGTTSQMQFFRDFFERAPFFAAALAVWRGRGVRAGPAQVDAARTWSSRARPTSTPRRFARYFTGTDQASVNRAVADLSATGMFSKGQREDRRRQGRRHASPRAARSSIASRSRATTTLKADQLAVEVQSKAHTGFRRSEGRRRRRSHQGRLQEDRPQRHEDQLPAGATAQRARRPRLQDRRRRQDRRARNQVRRQQGRLGLSPALADADDAK